MTTGEKTSAEAARDEKARLRAEAVKARDLLEDKAARSSAAAMRLAGWLAQNRRDSVLAGYWPIRGEVDPRPAMAAHQGVTCLPAVTGHGLPLRFRTWQLGQNLLPGPFGTFHPHDTAESVQPQVVIVPLTAFDRHGGRLGYGGGFYDRTLEYLRLHGAILAVGLAFAAQEVPEIPTEAFDQRLDLIVTEDGPILPGL